MWSVRVIAGVILLFCFLEQRTTAQGNALASKKYRHYFEPEWIKFKEDSIGSILAYMTCDKEKLEADEEAKCTVVREVNDFQSPINASSCELTLKNQDRGALPIVSPFGKDKVVVVSVEYSPEVGQTFKFKTIQFDTCKFHREEIVIPAPDRRLYLLREVSLTAYEDTFDVAFESVTLCQDKLCKITFDAEGNKISEPAGWIKIDSDIPLRFILPISTHWPARGCFILNKKPNGDQLFLVVNNDPKLLKIQKHKYHFIHSASYGLITYCTQTAQTETAICEQIDQTGNTKFEIGPYHEDVLIRSTLENLPGGGFIIAMYNPKTKVFTIKKFDAEGKQVGALTFNEDKCDIKRLYANVWSVFGQFSYNRDTNAFCLYLTCFHPISGEEAGRVDQFVKCFSDNDLSL